MNAFEFFLASRAMVYLYREKMRLMNENAEFEKIDLADDKFQGVVNILEMEILNFEKRFGWPHDAEDRPDPTGRYVKRSDND